MSKEVGFSVSAKAARLIGRESIRDVGGALIELIKNAYDADAESVFVRYDIPFPHISEGTTFNNAEIILSSRDYEIFQTYCDEGTNTISKDKEEDEELHILLNRYNSICIVDDGKGMDTLTLSTVWMNIGTNDKEVNGVSKKGRIKTGAKGIGRFALDKLSRYTQVYTQAENDTLLSWNLDWELFETSETIDNVKARIDKLPNKTIKDLTYDMLGDDPNSLPQFENSTGTCIVLSPLRDDWYDRDFRKVNNTVKSLNPLTSSDKFQVNIENSQKKELSFVTKDMSNEINRSRYDYKINVSVVGDELKIIFDRNEIDINIDEIDITPYKKPIRFKMDNFWQRDAFRKEYHNRESYDGTIEFTYSIKKVVKDFSSKEYSSLGNFAVDMFFVKNAASTTPFIKKFVLKNRREMLKNFSGVKIYRDEFKVRPYGDDGHMYDWLGLGPRQQRSPGAPSNNAPWRIMPYQLIGEVLLSKESNPYLEDQANREGIADSRIFDLFTEVILFSIDKFEEDRQYPLREYGKLFDELKKSQKDEEAREFNERIAERVNYSYEEQLQTLSSSQEVQKETMAPEKTLITPEEIEEVVERIADNSYDSEEVLKVLMALSNSGTMASTFAHELSHIGTDLSVRNLHLKSCIDYILKGEEYSGLFFFNPYPMLDDYEKTDRMLSSWIKVMTNPIKKETITTRGDLLISINKICEEWGPLLDSKQITVSIGGDDEALGVNSISEMDLYLIINNFILNSAWFLETVEGKNREMDVFVTSEKNKTVISLKNNGPSLDSRYLASPDQIFMASITSKTEGSGLGLWILSEAAIRCGGRATVNTEVLDGFQIDIILG
ncbi:ATP-binding protein [Lactococcus lactis]|uniref:ATP-binding protein n=1 Tax=Lactococcus lactis TaxID=1358 RepID=UPI003D2C1A8F